MSRIGLGMFRVNTGNARLVLTFTNEGGIVTTHVYGDCAVVNRVAVTMSRSEAIELALWIRDNVQAKAV